MNDPGATLEATQSLCPVCLRRLDASRTVRKEGVYLEKHCPEHGPFETLIWKGAPQIETWRRPKIATRPIAVGHEVKQGCPFDCGLCPEHRQRSCSVILEVTQRCNLGCKVCFADAGSKREDPSAAVISKWYETAREYGGACNIQLSGGEPTLRDDLPELIAMGRKIGFTFIQINTNGLRLAADFDYVKALKEAGAGSIFLQFDGVDDAVYRTLRGRNLMAEKEAAIAACERVGLGVVMVPTLVPGCNTDAVGDILHTALKFYPTVRGVHFQPISYFGRHPGAPAGQDRLTLPELMGLIEIQTQGIFKVDHFAPPGCEHSLCSFHAQYLVSEKKELRPLHGGGAAWRDEPPIRAEEGAARAIGSVARQWSASTESEAVSAAGRCACNSITGCSGSAPLSLDDFLEMAKSRTFSVSAMAFQDVWNLDLERVRQCCIHVMAADGRLIPFCLYNLTAADGRPLYRK